MEKNEVKGKVKNIAGKAERKVGEVTGNKKTQAQGAARQAEGKVQEIAGKAKDSIKPRKNKAA